MAQDILLEQLGSSDPIVRNRSALALGKRGICSDNVITALLTALKDPEWRVRGNAAKAIAKLSPLNELGLVNILMLLNDCDEAVRIEALEASEYMLESGCIVSDRIFSQLVDLSHSERPYNRKDAMLLLKHATSYSVNLIEPIKRCMYDSVENVRYWAVVAAGVIPEVAVQLVPDMANILKTDSDEIKSQIIATLGRLGVASSSAVQIIEDMLTHHDKHIQFDAAYALVRIGSHDESGSIRNILNITRMSSDNADERSLASKAIEELDHRRETRRKV